MCLNSLEVSCTSTTFWFLEARNGTNPCPSDPVQDLEEEPALLEDIMKEGIADPDFVVEAAQDVPRIL